MVGLQSEIRGEIPKGELLIAGKHQSFFDGIMIVSVVEKPKFTAKASLKWVLSLVNTHCGLCVPVPRKTAEAIKYMLRYFPVLACRSTDHISSRHPCGAG